MLGSRSLVPMRRVARLTRPRMSSGGASSLKKPARFVTGVPWAVVVMFFERALSFFFLV
jgi:hypothetical protein